MKNEFLRTELLIGKDGLKKLKNSKVAVFGIGGVGSFVVEGLIRSGIGNLVLIDNDNICITNINRQIHATKNNIGRVKVEVMKERILEILPDAKVDIINKFYLPENADNIIPSGLDYIVDAIDTITSKISLSIEANKRNIPIISSMGTGNKLNPTLFEVDDIYNTSVCPLAKVMRKELRTRGIKSLKVVYSKEKPIKPNIDLESEKTIGSISFVPSVAGLIIASEVVKDILKTPNI
ncbi:MAG: tRNA threonylcarbamoyladenosine dehydratase [Clostridiales bacterium]